MKRKIIIILLLTLFCSNILYSHIAYANNNPENISSEAYAVLETGSNRLLYSKNKDEKLPMASTTKVMTAIIALEKGNLNDVIEIKKEYTGIEGTSIYLAEGEKLSLEDLLHGLMLVSGNDAAVAIAHHIGGSIEGFAKIMNKKAKELGMNNTNFKNPNGLPDEEHYTTAYDFSLLASYAMKNENFVKIINDKKWSMSYKGKENGRTIYNKNKLLKNYEGANGVKTGFTKKAGKCFVFAAKRNNMQVVGVVLRSNNHYIDSTNLLNMAFNEFTLKKIIEKDEYIKTIPMKNTKKGIIKLSVKEDIFFPVKKDENIEINYDKIYNSGSDNYIADYSVNIKNSKEKYEYTITAKTEKQSKSSIYNFFSNLLRFTGLDFN